ncbi:alpha/beta hydrolase fold-domain-containing protein [Calycina marina]|uniref:Alpha/beta hydrolase fold-domain-containing protein n=1 Tax=Calycina marina TaxID=1763456 RepID=A0A9P8CEK3_9HELO|nr:alpha/beta hydrolase fold-domain-containing protein [Calycina marina]
MASKPADYVTGTDGTSSIIVDHRTSHSLPSSAIQSILKPFGNIILKAGKPLPAGSPQLKPYHSSSRKVHIEETRILDTYIYVFTNTADSTSKSPALLDAKEPVKRKLYYFAGGGFRGAPTDQHWSLCAELSTQLPQYSINLVSYPLAPNSPAHHAIPQLEKLYDEMIVQAQAEGSRVTLMGDSAGGNIVIVLGIYGATRWLASGAEGVYPLQNVFAICPAADLRHEHADILAKETKDPVLSKKIIQGVANGWKGDWELADPRVSPALADLSVFKRAGIKVDGMTAGYDCLGPEGVAFREQLAKEGVRGEWLDWERQMHCFILMFQYKFSEPAAAKDWMLGVLRRNAEMS